MLYKYGGIYENTDYKKLSQNQIDLAEKLSAAFTANDNTGAALIMTQINKKKKEGHTKYK